MIVVDEGSCFLLSAGKLVTILMSCIMENIFFVMISEPWGKQECEVVQFTAMSMGRIPYSGKVWQGSLIWRFR